MGASNASGEVLVFLDGHCNPERGAIERLVEDVERVDGQSLITPTILALDTGRWKNKESQVGHGYRLELDTFDCGWLPLAGMRKVRLGGREFYESPAAIGCAFAVHRELYDDLRGFDPHMRIWGVEDLDFSLKCWLMGHSILHDPDARIGHRFREKFDNYDVPVAHILVNKLRMAYKNFTRGVWSEWLERCRQEHPGRLKEHPEGLWACVWKLFNGDCTSAEQERAYLLARRPHDEFWFAQQFGLSWPRLERTSLRMGVREFSAAQAEAAESPSPPPCELTGIDPSPAHVCRGETITFTAQGIGLDAVQWTARHADPETGTGAQFTTKWAAQPEGGYSGVDAVCGESSAYSRVTITTVFKIFNDADPSETEYTSVCPGNQVTLNAEPRPLISGFPSGQPVWRILDQPEGSTLADPPAGNYLAPITPTIPGTYLVEARCGTSSRTFEIYCVRVTFSPTPVRTGFTIPWEDLPILTRVTAAVEPAFAMPDVSFDVGGTGAAGPTRVAIQDLIAPVGNTYLFNLRAYSATPHQIPGDDTTIRALVKGQVCDEVSVVVHVPKRFARPYPNIAAKPPEVAANLVGDQSTSPVWFVPGDPELGPNEVGLGTTWHHVMKIQINDQFGNKLDPIYNGVAVEENLRGTWVDINQYFSDGTYNDPVGPFWMRLQSGPGIPDDRDPSEYIFDKDDPVAKGWPEAVDDTPEMPIRSFKPQVFAVKVGGHAVGNVNRRAITTRVSGVDMLEIQWPPK